MRSGTAVIAGTGHAEPVSVRGNDDPAFDWIKAHQPAGVDLFQGYVSRRVLAPDEDLIDILVPSARMAMAEGAIKSTGRMYQQEYVLFLRATGGKIISLREYFDPTRAAKALKTPILGLEA